MYLVLSKGGQNNISKLVIVVLYQQHYTAVIERQFNRYFLKPELLISRTFDFSNNVYNKADFTLSVERNWLLLWSGLHFYTY